MELPDVVYYAIPMFIAMMLIEGFGARVFGWKANYDRKDTAASITMGLGNLAVGLVGGLLVAWVFEHAHVVRLFDIGWSWWAFVACFFLEDFTYYWIHRCGHEVRWLWASHITHHSSQHYNLSTALRQTWTGHVAMGFLFYVPMIVLGFEPAMVLFFGGTSLLYQFWLHTEAVDKLPRWFEFVFNTPSHHRVHHGTNPEYLDRNHGGVLIVWDRLFGTFEPEDRVGNAPVYGIVKNLETHNPLWIAFHEWVAIARDLRGARSVREAFAFAFGPPGWCLDGSRQTSAQIRAAVHSSPPVGLSQAAPFAKVPPLVFQHPAQDRAGLQAPR